MRTIILLAIGLLAGSAVHAQLYIDVTQSPYSANATCASDAGPAINSAITAALNESTLTYATGSTIYFPAGCYLINTQITDPGVLSNGHGVGIGITYLGFGRAVLSAGSSLTGSILKFGTNTATASRRRLESLYFECNSVSGVDGIDINGLVNSEFDDIEIRDCKGNGIATVGTNSQGLDHLSIVGGVITASGNSSWGIYAGPGSNFWTIKGMRLSYVGTYPTNAIGIEFEGFGDVCGSCDVEGWNVGLEGGQGNSMGGLEVSGGYFELNQTYAIRLGQAATSGSLVQGASIHGAYINGGTYDPTHNIYPVTPHCVELEQIDGFSVNGNYFHNCVINNVRGFADSTNPATEGADNGVVGPNSVYNYTGSVTYSLLGKNVALISPTCISSASPAACGYTSSGLVALPAGGNNLVVDAPFVQANSRITINEDMTVGSSFSPAITCNTVGGRTYSVTSKTPGTSFTITASTAPTTNPACLVFSFQN